MISMFPKPWKISMNELGLNFLDNFIMGFIKHEEFRGCLVSFWKSKY